MATALNRRFATGTGGYAMGFFKLSSVLTILWAQLFPGEMNIRRRFVGAFVMLIGGLLIAV